jgi:hypothetical protein
MGSAPICKQKKRVYMVCQATVPPSCKTVVFTLNSAAHLVPAHPWLCLQASFLPNYLQITSRKLLLFHGRHSRQQQRRLPHTSSSGTALVVRLHELVNSPVMAELQEMLSLGPGAEQERDLFNNWFSLQVGV